MFDRNQWLEWAKNSQQSNTEMKDSMFDVRKNDQTRNFLYEVEEPDDRSPPGAFAKAISKKLPKRLKHLPLDPHLSGGAKAALMYNIIPGMVDKMTPSGIKRSKEEKRTASTRIVPNPTDESVQFDEAALLLPFLPLLAKLGGAAAAAGGALGGVGGLVGGTVARSAIGHGIKKLATSGIRKVAKNPLRRVKSLGKEVAGHAVMSKAMGGGQRPENLAVSTRNESTEQLDEFIGKLLRGRRRRPSGPPTPPSQTRFQKIKSKGREALDKFKADPLTPATQLAKTYGTYWLMGKAMGGAQRDPMATQAQSTAETQAAASDRTTELQRARRPSAPLPTHSR